jgi:hypothetical protein
MKKSLFVLSLVTLAACNNASSDSKKAKVLSKSVVVPVVKYGIEGFYTGAFVPEKYNEEKEVFQNKITICIDSLDDTNVYGHSIVAGNERPFKGRYTKDNGTYTITASEPGDNKYDGQFSFTIDPQEKKLKGIWNSYDSKVAVTERSYELEERFYKYNPKLALPEDVISGPMYNTYKKGSDSAESLTSDVLKINASSTLLKSQDVENLYKADLEVLRNAIYARHGYSFKNPRMREVFDYVDWYMPVSTDVTSQLTDIEKKNIALLKRYETHASKYYDEFGR